jgi:hypothetical protein
LTELVNKSLILRGTQSNDFGFPAQAHQETARIVLALDSAIAAFRGGESSGLRGLDLGGRLPDDQADDTASERAGRADGQRRLPPRPDRVELAILTALADTYGADMVTNTSLGYALRLTARRGGVAFVQRVLLGESASDAQLSVMLTAGRAVFTQISLAFSDVFLADANAVLAGFMSRPPEPPTSKNGEDRE